MHAKSPGGYALSTGPAECAHLCCWKSLRAGPARGPGLLLLAAAVLLASAGAASADKVYCKDGTVTTGQIIADTGDSIVLAVGKTGEKTIVSISIKDIKAVVNEAQPQGEAPKLPPATAPADPDAAQGVGYYPLPIVGEIGLDVKAKTLALALEDARQRGPDYVVLYIDSAGGSVNETRLILDVLAEAQDLKLAAYVEQALSAAAIIALACPDICMKPSAVLGGVVPFKVGPEGTPQAVEEKFEAIIRAQFRAAAEMGGHPSVLVEAMMNPNMQLFLIEKDGKKTLAAQGEGKLLKDKGKVLALTAKEAMECGLVKGTARNLESMHEAMGIEAWDRLPGKGWALMMGQAALARRKLQKQQEDQARAAQLEELSPELKKIDDKIANVRTDLRLANTEVNLLKGLYEREVAAALAEYERERNRAANLGAVGRLRERENVLRNAENSRDSKLNSIRQQFESKAMAMKLKLQKLNESLKQLLAERRKVLSAERPK